MAKGATRAQGGGRQISVRSMGDGAMLRNAFAAYLGQSHGGARNLYQQFGYPTTIDARELQAIYSRNDIASRIVRAFPQATWRDAPLIRDEKGDSAEREKDTYSPFVEAVEDFFDAHRVSHFLERADRLSGIGRYGVLYMGFDDTDRPEEPLQGTARLLFLAPYIETSVTVNQWVTNPRHPRFGKPQTYVLNSGGDLNGDAASARQSIRAHHSRVIHIAEFLEQDETYGTPRLLPIFNRLKDLEKVVGGAAETFWLTANRGIMLSADPETIVDGDALTKFMSDLEEFQHQTRRTLFGQGVEPHVLGSESPDPEPNAAILLDLIAGATGIPKRILIGSERGELSSKQDENNWAARIDERRNNFATHAILKPFIDCMIRTGNLPRPQGAWWVEWPETAGTSELDKAQVAVAKATAIATYSNAPSGETIVPKQEFRKDILGLPPESEYEAEGYDDLDMLPAPGDPLALPAPEGEADAVPLDETADPDAAAFPGQEAVQDTALNGAQIASLKEIVEAVGAGMLNPDTAIELILVSFPTVTKEQADAIIDPMRGFEPTPEATVPIATAVAVHALATNARPRTLYVCRPVVNAEAIIKWARKQGFKGLLDADDLHVTIAHSRAQIDWLKVAPAYDQNENAELKIARGGARIVEPLGSEGAIVLLFQSLTLQWRHADFKAAGASWDYPEYQPHVTLSYGERGDVGLDLSKVKPYVGEIILGPEMFVELDA